MHIEFTKSKIIYNKYDKIQVIALEKITRPNPKYNEKSLKFKKFRI